MDVKVICDNRNSGCYFRCCWWNKPIKMSSPLGLFAPMSIHVHHINVHIYSTHSHPLRVPNNEVAKTIPASLTGHQSERSGDVHHASIHYLNHAIPTHLAGPKDVHQQKQILSFCAINRHWSCTWLARTILHRDIHTGFEDYRLEPKTTWDELNLESFLSSHFRVITCHNLCRALQFPLNFSNASHITLQSPKTSKPVENRTVGKWKDKPASPWCKHLGNVYSGLCTAVLHRATSAEVIQLCTQKNKAVNMSQPVKRHMLEFY